MASKKLKKRKHLFSVYVGNLHRDVTEKDLADLFGGCGEIADHCIIPPKDGDKVKYGFVRYRDREEAFKAIRDLNGWTLKASRIVVDVATDTQSKLHTGSLAPLDVSEAKTFAVEDNFQEETSPGCVDSIINLNRVKETCLWVNSELAATNKTGIVKTSKIMLDLETKGGASSVFAPLCKPSGRCFENGKRIGEEFEKYNQPEDPTTPSLYENYMNDYTTISQQILALTKGLKEEALPSENEKTTAVVSKDKKLSESSLLSSEQDSKCDLVTEQVRDDKNENVMTNVGNRNKTDEHIHGEVVGDSAQTFAHIPMKRSSQPVPRHGLRLMAARGRLILSQCREACPHPPLSSVMSSNWRMFAPNVRPVRLPSPNPAAPLAASSPVKGLRGSRGNASIRQLLVTARNSSLSNAVDDQKHEQDFSPCADKQKPSHNDVATGTGGAHDRKVSVERGNFPTNVNKEQEIQDSLLEIGRKFRKKFLNESTDIADDSYQPVTEELQYKSEDKHKTRTFSRPIGEKTWKNSGSESEDEQEWELSKNSKQDYEQLASHLFHVLLDSDTPRYDRSELKSPVVHTGDGTSKTSFKPKHQDLSQNKVLSHNLSSKFTDTSVTPLQYQPSEMKLHHVSHSPKMPQQ